MEASNLALDYLMQYKVISSKIKKRFLRKPNIAEASEDFTKLARSLTDCEAWPQAGLCCLATARCEQSLSSSTTEAKSMIEAAQNFIKTECVNQQLLCHSYDEHLISAITCYEYTMNIYKDDGKPVLAASLALELSEVLCSLGKHSEEMTYLQVAESFLSNSPMYLLSCWSMMTSCKIELGDLDGALTLLTKILSTIKNSEKDYLTGAVKEIYTRCEICSVFLLLILQPLPQHMKTDQAQLLEKYSSPTSYTSSNVPFEDDEMVILLQSLVIACQTRDLESITELTLDLSSKLSGQPLHLLHVLEIEMYRS